MNNGNASVEEYERFLRFKQQEAQKQLYTDLRTVRQRPIHFFNIPEEKPKPKKRKKKKSKK